VSATPAGTSNGPASTTRPTSSPWYSAVALRRETVRNGEKTPGPARRGLRSVKVARLVRRWS
jgi:hypothetical protein